MNKAEEYDPEGGHTREEADAAYAQLYKELHGEELKQENENEQHPLHRKIGVDEEALIVSITEEGPQLLKVKVVGPVDFSNGADMPLFHRAAAEATTSALVWRTMKEHNCAISDELSINLLTGIIRQCDGFKSPDTASLDREAAVTIAQAMVIDIADFVEKTLNL